MIFIVLLCDWQLEEAGAAHAAVVAQRDALALKVAQAAGAIHAAEELKEAKCEPNHF